MTDLNVKVYHDDGQRVAVYSDDGRPRVDWPGGEPELTIPRHRETVGVQWTNGAPETDQAWQWMALWAVQAPVGGKVPLVGRHDPIRVTERLTPRSTRILMERPDRIELNTSPYREVRRD